MTRKRDVRLRVQVEHPDDWSDQDVHDVLRWRLDVGDLDLSEVPDLSAITLVDTRLLPDRPIAPLPILPGAMVERRGTDLDAREVISVGRDFLTLDLLGQESPRLPLDNYVVVVPADGAL